MSCLTVYRYSLILIILLYSSLSPIIDPIAILKSTSGTLPSPRRLPTTLIPLVDEEPTLHDRLFHLNQTSVVLVDPALMISLPKRVSSGSRQTVETISEFLQMHMLGTIRIHGRFLLVECLLPSTRDAPQPMDVKGQPIRAQWLRLTSVGLAP